MRFSTLTLFSSACIVSLVGTPDRQYVWILSRTPRLPEGTYTSIVAKAHTLGFDAGQMIRTTRTEQMH
jgi:apolipoprotein D and lipocalin family protein